MSELLAQTLQIIVPAAATLLAAWFGVLGAKLKTVYAEKANTEVKKQVVATTVEYIQQVYETLNGDEKLHKAIEQATILLNEKGLTVSELELRMLIESSVYGLKQGLIEPAKEIVIEANTEGEEG